jgi:hypothetical protein
MPETRCSMIAGTRASITRPVRQTRQCGVRRWASASTGWVGAKPVTSSSAPSIDGTLSSAQAAPSPQADTCTSPSAGRERSRTVAVPCGVRMPRHTVPSSSTLNVGSALPLRRIERVIRTSHGQEALGGFRKLVHRYGERAPGAGTDRGLWVQPSAESVRMVPSWEWLRMHIDPARSRAVVRAAQVAPAIERTASVPADEADRRLRSLPGIGVWTSAEVRFRAHGDADAVSFGDYHIAKNVGWALTGQEVDDDGLAELLEPYRPHRYRVQRLVELAGLSRPRHGPRMAPRRHLPTSRG